MLPFGNQRWCGRRRNPTVPTWSAPTRIVRRWCPSPYTLTSKFHLTDLVGSEEASQRTWGERKTPPAQIHPARSARPQDDKWAPTLRRALRMTGWGATPHDSQNGERVPAAARVGQVLGAAQTGMGFQGTDASTSTCPSPKAAPLPTWTISAVRRRAAKGARSPANRRVPTRPPMDISVPWRAL